MSEKNDSINYTGPLVVVKGVTQSKEVSQVLINTATEDVDVLKIEAFGNELLTIKTITIEKVNELVRKYS